MMLFLLLCLLGAACVHGGSKCPDRSEIYPCICLDRSIGKSKFDTTVVCQGLNYGESLKSIEPGLSSMEIDKFLLYDSYWSDHQRLLQANARIPVNYVNNFRMKEVKVVDTRLSSFACPETGDCRTTYLKTFTAINSSVTENPTCSSGFSINSWINCPEYIEVIRIDGGYKTYLTLNPEFFPAPLTKLKALYLPNNRILKIERTTFNHARFPELQTLDLSKNSLREVNIKSTLKLKYLDLSSNSIRSMVDLQYLPHLMHLNLSNNNIISLLPNEWVNMPSKLRTIDFSKNDLKCDCSFNWVNSTFHINTNLEGACSSPEQVANMKIRRASRLLSERCDGRGVIQSRKITTTTPKPT